MNFDYKKEKNNGIVIFSFHGELIDKNQANNLLTEVDQMVNKLENKFILDLHELKYVNSSGLNILINILTKARKTGGDVAIFNLSPKVEELLKITKLDGVFNIVPNQDSAIKKLS